MGVTDEYGCTQYYKKRKDMDMKHKKMEKMIDKYVPMMLALSDMDSDQAEIKAAFILDRIVSDTERSAKEKFSKLYHELFTY